MYLSFGFKKKGSYTFQWIIFLKVYLHCIVLERWSQVILLRFNIIKVNRKLFLSSCGWAKAVRCRQGRQSENLLFWYSFLLTPVWRSCLCPAPLGFFSFSLSSRGSIITIDLNSYSQLLWWKACLQCISYFVITASDFVWSISPSST